MGDTPNPTTAMPTLEEASRLLKTLDSFVQAVAVNQEGWQQFIITLGNDNGLLNQKIQQLMQQEAVYETRLEESAARAQLAENEKNQAIGAKVHLQEELTKAQTLIATSAHNGTTKPPLTNLKKSAKFNDPEKFTGKDKEKLEAWLIGMHTKMRVNADWFVEPGWSEEDVRQSKMLYVIDRLDGDALGHVKPHVTEEYTVSDFADWQAMVTLIKRVYGETDPEGAARRKVINCTQANRDFEDFWSYLHRNGKQAKMNDIQLKDYLTEKLNSEMSNQLISVLDMPTELHAYVAQLRKLNNRMKEAKEKDARRPYRAAGQNITSNTLRTNPTGTRNVAPVGRPQAPPPPPKPAFIRASTTSGPSTTPAISGTHAGPMDLSSSGKRGPLTQEEKEYRRKNGLCNYCGGPGHFAADHHDSATLNAKKRAYNLRLASAKLTPHYTDITDESATDVSENDQSSS